MLTPVLVISVTGAFVLGVLAVIGRWLAVSKTKHLEEAKDWPTAEATIQQYSTIVLSRYSGELPCFSFSYIVDDEYYSGEFALFASGDGVDTLRKGMINRKITVCYDPTQPSKFLIVEKKIDGYQVRQVAV